MATLSHKLCGAHVLSIRSAPCLEFFETYLPPHIKTLLSFEALRMEKDSFVERSLKKSIV
ncbi:MAG: Rpn family recombination-promoting nuclease/putative transposase [Rickettsia conorii subsp. raoultii]|uniref:Rpn family recombination-promoting nuclease/putative transposase n=1 Tax=Rickettsia conorii TaxID=781 RepID=UPI003AEFD00B